MAHSARAEQEHALAAVVKGNPINHRPKSQFDSELSHVENGKLVTDDQDQNEEHHA